MAVRSFVFHAYGADVRLACPGDIDISGLKRHLAPEVFEQEARVDAADLLLTRSDGLYELTVEGRPFGPYSTIEDAFRGIANGIHFVLGRRSPMTFLHAGAIELDGMAVIFPGRSRWGKSTLVSSLVAHGCGYLSDEYAVVSPDGLVHPLSKPIRTRRAAGGIDYSFPRPIVAPDGLPCAAMILTRFQQGTRWEPEPLSPGFAVLGALPAALLSRDAPGQVLQALTALSAGAACYQGPRGDGEPSAEALRKLTGNVGTKDFKREAYA